MITTRERFSALFPMTSKEGFQMAFNFLFWQSTDLSMDVSAVFKEKQGGDALDAILGGRSRIFIHIEFGHLESVAVLLSQSVKDGGYGAARSAPGCPAIHQNRPGKRKDLLLEAPICHFHRLPRSLNGIDRLSTLSTNWSLSKSAPWYSILYPAMAAWNDDRIAFHHSSSSPKST